MNRLFFFIILSVIVSCEKSNFTRWNLIGTPVVSNLELTSNNIKEFTVSANFESLGKDKNCVVGLLISKNNSIPDLVNFDTIIYLNVTKPGVISSNIKWFQTGDLNCRAFVINKIDTSFSNSISFKWPGNSTNLPNVLALNPIEISFFSVKSKVSLIENGGLEITRFGILISKSSNPTLSNSIVYDQQLDSTQFSLQINNLENDERYYIRGFAENFAGIGYSGVKTFRTKKLYQIGETGPAGGKVFYVKLDNFGGWNFLESSPVDFETNLPWGINNNIVSGLKTSIGSGKSNTSLITASYGLTETNYASKACQTFVLNNYSDWFLPSRDELIAMYQNLYLSGQGVFQNDQKYWSSSNDEFFIQNAWNQKMSTNSSSSHTSSEPITSHLRVKPIRRF